MKRAAGDAQSVCRRLRRALPASEEGDITSRFYEATAEITAECAHAHHENSHLTVLPSVSLLQPNLSDISQVM
jgi:hypothetical protein